MSNPAVLILDEPCAGLDPVARERFLAFVQQLASKKSAPTLLFVTHHVEEIMPAFTHALLLKRGKVAAAGPIPKVLTGDALSGIFGEALKLRHSGERYQLTLA
jgi:iron complex transport system ATP-binding protein